MVASGPTEIWGVVFFLGYMPKKSDFLNPFSVWWRNFFFQKIIKNRPKTGSCGGKKILEKNFLHHTEKGLKKSDFLGM